MFEGEGSNVVLKKCVCGCVFVGVISCLDYSAVFNDLV